MQIEVRSDILVYEAKSFYNTFINLYDFSQNDVMYFVPAIVNGSFSVELGIKAILSKRGIKYGRDHNLVILFEKLPEDIQDTIWRWVEEKNPYYADTGARNKELLLISDIFTQWRYCFERDGAVAVDLGFLSVFANAVIGVMFYLGYNVEMVKTEAYEASNADAEKILAMNRSRFIEKNARKIKKRTKTTQKT